MSTNDLKAEVVEKVGSSLKLADCYDVSEEASGF
ncbi:hypothetical protein TSMEX_009780 [Taenia solium]|eukprot:TsM_000208000 transcript=TsM_000208000 gene=TsM_000208000